MSSREEKELRLLPARPNKGGEGNAEGIGGQRRAVQGEGRGVARRRGGVVWVWVWPLPLPLFLLSLAVEGYTTARTVLAAVPSCAGCDLTAPGLTDLTDLL